jgi:hypothetical protein
MSDIAKDTLYREDAPSLNERLYQEEPVIAGVKVRPYSNKVKLKLSRIIRWLDIAEADRNEEILFAFLYLIAAPIERVSINTLNRDAYLIDKDAFMENLTSEDLNLAGDWFMTVTGLEKETEIEVVQKPSSGSSRESAPPNS